MLNLTQQELLDYINEDVPYFDLTTSLQNCRNQSARIEIYTREDVVVSCTEESARIAEHFDCQLQSLVASAQSAEKNTVILSYQGDYNQVHQAYRLTQILLEYSCSISTYAARMKQVIDRVNPHCELLTTRKTFPFAKKFCIKAAMTGGAMPHRLGLGETILFFNAHRIIYQNDLEFYRFIQQLKERVVEKKIVVESEQVDDAFALMEHGADVLQLDKLELAQIHSIVEFRNEAFPAVKLLVAGGINVNNVEAYASTGIDGVVTSAVYQAGMVNLGAIVTRV